MDQVAALAAEVRRLQRMVRLLATRSVVTLSDASDSVQRLQLDGLGDAALDAIEHLEPYGFTSRPLEGAEAIVANLFGNQDNAVAVVVGDRRFRLKNMQQGEVALWTDEGDVIHFKRGNHIYVDALNQVTAKAGTKVVVDTPLAEFTGDIVAAGNVSDGTGSMQAMRDTYNDHDHPGDSGGTTGKANQEM